jgi:hypothetical protein
VEGAEGEVPRLVAKQGVVSFQIQDGTSGGDRPVMTTEEYARYLESELREAEEAVEEQAAAGGRDGPRKKVVQFVNPGDISSSDDEEEDAGGGDGSSGESSEWPDGEEGEDLWASMDPELLLKLQTLSCVLIQRAYRHYRARRCAHVSVPVCMCMSISVTVTIFGTRSSRRHRVHADNRLPLMSFLCISCLCSMGRTCDVMPVCISCHFLSNGLTKHRLSGRLRRGHRKCRGRPQRHRHCLRMKVRHRWPRVLPEGQRLLPTAPWKLKSSIC